ncbi:hypothetical protein BKA82DRAFT_1001513 [Pisolithus tinctorius]|uniref:Uncharacterized protein n=1 Tax=Pisolithus tinctorius Marx 270 TaxID=870435 RepID=A0A0C3J2D5_PISTI|nr:hypothetical protein BKA82DRAFT_1001513 [Pisolithus tinctorius]KIO03238.1 hypothetical protein M404DRAFT_1001513 [Pisolithus tinctorius Marx 270]
MDGNTHTHNDTRDMKGAMGTAQRRRNLERLGGAEFLAGQWVAARRYIPVYVMHMDT